jgi:uncharacterized protein
MALDLIRGIAVLGILAVNIAGFAGPSAGTDTPWLPHRATPADEAAFALTFVLFEGKMRALFSMLFGASMLLFVERAEDARRNGEMLQLRRLGWLALFGYLHYLLLWWGDILFVYAVAGFFALPLRRFPDRVLLGVALAIFVAWHGWGMAGSLVEFIGAVSPAAQHEAMVATLSHMQVETVQARLGFGAQIIDKLATAPGWPLVMTLYTIGETLPLMLLGMVLLRSGFFAGEWPRRRLVGMAGVGLGLGLAWTLALLGWAWPRHFPPLVMPDILAYWAAPGHMLMALGYAALIMLVAPHLAASWLGRRLSAAGRVAFSNYLGTTMVMTAIFYGWGLGWYGRVAPVWQPLFVLGGWALMLGWSAPWLSRFRQGPLEWAWRSLTEWRVMAMLKRKAPPPTPSSEEEGA